MEGTEFWPRRADLTSRSSRRQPSTDVWLRRRPIEQSKILKLPSSRRTSPVGCAERMTIERFTPVDAAGGGRSWRSAAKLVKHLTRDGDLRHLEGDVAAMADDLRGNLDQRLLEGRHRPVLYRLRRRQCAQEIAEIVGERVKLETDGVGGERST
jgi:hypothetical protein